MKDTNSIVKEYQKADAEKRLSLFLECPSLRREFMQIEQGPGVIDTAGASQSGTGRSIGSKSAFYPLARLLKCCHRN